MAAEVTRMPLRLSNGVLAEPTPESLAAAERIKAQLRRRNSIAGDTSNEATARDHRRYLHAQAELEEETAELSQVYTLAELDHEVRQRIQAFAATALQVLEDIITGKLPASLALRAKYAHLHLGRAGYGPITKTATLSQHLTREDIETLKQRCNEASGDVNE